MRKEYPIHLLIFLFFGFLVFVVYKDVIHAPFVFDDMHTIVENEVLHNISRFFQIQILFSQRPLVDLTFSINYFLGGHNSFGYHFLNIIIHFCNGILVYLLSMTFFNYFFINKNTKPNSYEGNFHKKIIFAVITTFIFLLHPLQTQAVSYIAQRYTSMAAFFYLLSIIFFIQARSLQKRDQPRTGLKSLQVICLYLLVVFSGLAGFLSKQNVASLPFALLFVEYMLFDQSWRSWKRKFSWVIPVLFLVSCLIIYIGLYRGEAIHFGQLLEDLSSKAQETERVSHGDYFLTQISVLVQYFRMFIAPYGLHPDHMYPFTHSLLNVKTMACLLFLLGLVFLAGYTRKMLPVVCFGIVWFFITISVESSVFPISDALMEHRMYLPLFGLALITSWLVCLCLNRKTYLGIGMSVVIVISLSWLTLQRNQVWSDPLMLWSDVVTKSPENSRAYNNLGEVYIDRGQYVQAEKVLKQSIALKQVVPTAHLNLGLAYAHQKKYEKAKGQFLTALALKPDYAKAHFNLASIYLMEQELTQARQHLLQTVRKKPTWKDARLQLGDLALRLDETSLARRQFQFLLRQEPDNVHALEKMARLLVESGQFTTAQKYVRRLLQLNQNSTQAQTDMALILMKQGKDTQAREHLQRAIALDPNNNRAKSIMIDILYGQK
jgi:Tfp pilus assembly protein PilF